MALEDLAMFRTIPNGTVFYPSDPVSMERAVELAANTQGIVFIRSSRPTSVCVYPMEEKFEVGKSKVGRPWRIMWALCFSVGLLVLMTRSVVYFK